MFPEWNIDNENWNDASDVTGIDVKYPSHIEISTFKTVKEMLGLDITAEIDAKTMKSAAKDKKHAPAQFDEANVDYAGRQLPRVFLDKGSKNKTTTNDEEALKYAYNWPFHLNTPPTKSYEYTTYVDAPPERDPLMCISYDMIKRFGVPLLGCEASPNSQYPFLWHALYPKNKAGRACYNPSGKYCVKLFLAAKWRKVKISDTLPISADGRPAIASSSELYELWPSLLAKAVYTVYTACGSV